MGTKNNPGAFDCYASAEPDEPMFVLLGRDPLAALLVECWAHARSANGKGSNARTNEALHLADQLEDWPRPDKPDPDAEQLLAIARSVLLTLEGRADADCSRDTVTALRAAREELDK